MFTTLNEDGRRGRLEICIGEDPDNNQEGTAQSVAAQSVADQSVAAQSVAKPLCRR
jgi:hypothetical protein